MNFPSDLIGCVLTQVILLNDEKTSLKTIINLSMSSKTFYTKVNSATACLLKGRKFSSSSEHFASKLNNMECRKWLWNYIQASGDFETYQSIQDIYAITRNILQEAKEAGFNFIIWDPSPNPHTLVRCTKRGLKLELPSLLRTPLGCLNLYSICGNDEEINIRIQCALLKSLNGSFKRMYNWFERYPEIIEELSLPEGPIFKKPLVAPQRIDREDLRNRVGSRNLFMNNVCGVAAVYRVGNKSNKDILPVRTYEVITRVWKLLELNHQGIDPITKESK